jgi:hypothetical protein
VHGQEGDHAGSEGQAGAGEQGRREQGPDGRCQRRAPGDARDAERARRRPAGQCGGHPRADAVGADEQVAPVGGAVGEVRDHRAVRPLLVPGELRAEPDVEPAGEQPPQRHAADQQGVLAGRARLDRERAQAPVEQRELPERPRVGRAGQHGEVQLRGQQPAQGRAGVRVQVQPVPAGGRHLRVAVVHRHVDPRPLQALRERQPADARPHHDDPHEEKVPDTRGSGAVVGYRAGVADEVLPAWTLVQAYHVVARGFTAVFAEVGLTPVQFGVLAVVADTPGPTQAELARAVMVRPQSVGEIVEVLERRGLLRREGEGGRGRRRPLVLTDAGRECWLPPGRACSPSTTRTRWG